MAEPQPSQIKEGDQAPQSIPSSTHDQAAALSSLDNRTDTSSQTADTDSAALGHAMQNLKVESKVEEKKNVKVDMADVGLLVEHLDVSKPRATELLKANDADAVKAMRAWIAA